MASNPYACPCDRRSAYCSVCLHRETWVEGFEAGVAVAKLGAKPDTVSWWCLHEGEMQAEGLIDWTEVDYALDKIKEEA